ncbi:MAG: ATP-binding protein [Pirellulales bacterium]
MTGKQKSTADSPLPDHNPFATRYVRPGALDFVFSSGPSTAELVQRLAEAGGWGQIIGPHGSGKSTLLAAVVEELRRACFSPVLFSLRDSQRRMPAGWVKQVRQEPISVQPTIVIVDGYEQLNWLATRRLRRKCLRLRWGLLVSAHHDIGLPTMHRTASTLDLAVSLVGQLTGERPPIDRDVIRRAFVNHNGNLRDVFFELYDHYEQHYRRSPDCRR